MTTQTPRQEPETGDWHPADIVAALRKAGWSLRQLSRHHGYHPSNLQHAMRFSRPGAERLIADAIGIPPERIWPTRYAQRTQRTTRRGRKSGSTEAES